jgi:hypothetical protein
MATIAQNALTLADWAKRTEDDKISTIVEILNDTNEILDDMLWVQGNLPTGHKTTVRSGLPSVAWRMLNYGIQPSKSRTVQVQDACGMLEAYSKVDKDLANLNGLSPEFRMSEDKAFIEAMNQEFAATLFYGNTTVNPERFLGFGPRFNSTTAENGVQLIPGGGTNTDDCTSVWLVCWGDQTVHGIFPKGSKVGLNHADLGEDTVSDGNGGEYQAYRSHYKWDCGLTVRDWRYVVRIPNITVADLTGNASGDSADLIDLMISALEAVPSLATGRPVFYCNKTIRTYLRKQIKNDTNVNLTQDQIAGKHVLSFDGIPVRRCDAILNTEDVVA